MNMLDLDVTMRQMADALAQRGDPTQALDRIVTAASDTIPGADYASITVRRPDASLETTVSTDSIAVIADEVQYELHEGPCYDAVTDETVTYSRDLSDDTQWPIFGPRIAEMGLFSQLGIRLTPPGDTAVGLNLYSRSRNAFERADGLPQLFASHARVALGYATQLQSLQGAVGTRETIGKAIGILMERYGLTDERAFEFLIRLSQTRNIKLRDIAADIVSDPAASTPPPK